MWQLLWTTNRKPTLTPSSHKPWKTIQHMKYLAAYIKSEDLGYFDESNAQQQYPKDIMEECHKVLSKDDVKDWEKVMLERNHTKLDGFNKGLNKISIVHYCI